MADKVLTFDIATLTMGELAAAEFASGLTASQLLGPGTARLMLAVFVLRLRSSGSAPTWSELANLRVADAQSLLLPSEPDNPSPK